MTQRGVVYVTKMKQNLTYETLSSTCYMNAKGLMQWREEYVVFRKEVKVKEKDGNGDEKEVKRVIEHKARIVTYVDEKKHKLVRLLTNDLEMPYEDIVAIYKKRWAIESLFKQLKQRSTSGRFACKEFSPALLLRRECQRHQDTDMGDAHRQPAAHAATERGDTCLELFRPRHHRQDYAHVLHRCHGVPRTPGKGLGGGH